MARPKEFDREEALEAAIQIFANHGYEGSSTDALLEAMGIGRQSLYDTFGDKRHLYLEALQHYSAHNVASLIRTMSESASPLAGLEAGLLWFADEAARTANVGCLGISAVCEFGRSDQTVNAVTDAMARTQRAALERLIGEAQARGEVAATVDVRVAAQFITATLAGVRVSARGGTPAATLRALARMAIRSLR